jgi:GTP cyclohydrolase IB
MKNDKRFLVDVELNNLPFPIKVLSRNNNNGQQTVANISIVARIMHDFEAKWINKFIQILHNHRDIIGTKTMSKNIMEYFTSLNASMVKIDFSYPFFVEKTTPVSNEKCLVKYQCTYSEKKSTVMVPKALLKIEVPIITSYPEMSPIESRSLFGQSSLVIVTIESSADIDPESIIDIVEKNALSPVYSFLSEDDEAFLIKKIHNNQKSSVEVIDNIKNELSLNQNIEWASVHCTNYGMLHNYATVVSTEKSLWVPGSGYDEDLDNYI